MHRIDRLRGLAACAVVLCSTVPMAAAAAPQTLDYNRDIRPILSDRCFRCHGPDAAHREADLRLDMREAAIARRASGAAIVPGDAAGSELVRRIASTDEFERMPPPDSGLELSARERELLRQWIDAGAEYQTHWAFRPPELPPLPQVAQADWPRGELDRFVLSELERQGLAPSPPADRATLLRRVTLDLTGLPPTAAELQAFLADRSRDAYEQVVDRLLASPHLGERLAVDWLDGARYSDTMGFYTDSERINWPWRDWVIAAFNANRPFDQFTIDQLAGDLLPGATLEQRIASGFHRLHTVTNETGIIDEEYRVGYVADRVDTTATVWLGLTLGCARCHDHKYDPLSQREYYRLFACFNNVAETGLVKEVNFASNPPPLIELPTSEQQAQLALLAASQQACDALLAERQPALSRAIRGWEPTALDGLPQVPTQGLVAHLDFEARTDPVGPAAVASTLVGKLAYTTGALGRGAQFDGTQYVEVAPTPRLEHDRPFTLALWLFPGGAPSGCVLSKMDGDAQARGVDVIWYKSQPRINIVHRWGESAIEVVAQQKFSRSWHHLVISYDGSGRAAGVRFYMDGVETPTYARRDDLAGSIHSEQPWQVAWKATGVGFEGGIDEVRLFDRALERGEAEAIYWRELIGGAVATPVAERTASQRDQLQQFYVTHHGDDELRQLLARRAALAAQRTAVQAEVISVSVMAEMPEPRPTHVLLRGQYDARGEQVEPGVPAALGALPDDGSPRRLALARWIVDDANPLTARVIVNRYWGLLFGAPLVRSANDFGSQGELPTHPELLDYLAVRFRDSGWDVKGLLRLIVTSATYRQSSHHTPDLTARDPENRLLARGPRYRLAAETLRDQALSLAGLLVPTIGGPSVKPYQPPGIWEAVSYNGDLTYVADAGEALYRRSLYTYWKRQAPPPAMLLFDAPTREVCTAARPRTNTPLQALVLLNDETYVEAARALATGSLQQPAGDAAERARWLFRRATARQPRRSELEPLVAYFEQTLAHYRAAPHEAQALLSVGASPVAAELDPCQLAAWTMVATVLLNLDEVVTQH